MSKRVIYGEYVRTRREIQTEHIHSLGCRDIRERERVALWKLILRRLGCIVYNDTLSLRHP